MSTNKNGNGKNQDERLDLKPIQEQQEVRGIRLVTEGMGIDTTFPMGELSTPVPILFSPFDKIDDIGLLQGGVQATAVEDGLALKWNAPYGYWLNDKQIPNKQRLKGRFERNAFYFAWHVYFSVLDYIRQRVNWKFAKVDTEQQLHIEFNEIADLKGQIDIALTEEYAKLFRLREESGYYRWIGLGYNENGGGTITPPFTVMEIPGVISGTRSVFLRAHSVPMMPGSNTPLIPLDANVQHAVISGLVHAFEDRTEWHASTALRAAMLHQVFKGDFEMTKLLSASSRAGMYPRLSSPVESGTGSKNAGKMWQRLIALSIAWEFFKNHYLPSDTINTGEVRYIFSGTGFTNLLENIISHYVSSSMLNLRQPPSNSVSGLFFLPASNMDNLSYKFSFAMQPRLAKHKTLIAPTDLKSKMYLDYLPEPINVDRNGMLSVTEEMQKTYGMRPVTIEPIHSVRQEVRLRGAGFQDRRMVIKDKVDNSGTWSASEMIRTLTLGWQPAYQPETILLARRFLNARLDEYKHFELLASTPLNT
jgi:hypothetical protein